VQVNVKYAGFDFFSNGGDARSDGVELSWQAKPLDSLTVAGWIAFNDAVLTSIDPNSTVQEHSGDRLPYSARYSANLSLLQEYPLTSYVTGYVRLEGIYASSRVGQFINVGTPTPRMLFPSYGQSNVSGGARWGGWRANLYANNLTDKRGIVSGTYGGLATDPNSRFEYVYIQPRTIGLSVDYKF